MILWNRFKGCLAAIGQSRRWEDEFNLSRAGLQASFIAQFFTLPAIYYIASVATKARAEALGQPVPNINGWAIVIIGLIYLMSFSAVAYILTMVFDKQDRLRPWVIIRHWFVFFMSWVGAGGFALYVIDMLPLAGAYGIVFAMYMGLLFVDIRLSQRIVGYDLGGAVLAACLIAITGLSVLSASVSQLI